MDTKFSDQGGTAKLEGFSLLDVQFSNEKMINILGDRLCS